MMMRIFRVYAKNATLRNLQWSEVLAQRERLVLMDFRLSDYYPPYANV